MSAGIEGIQGVGMAGGALASSALMSARANTAEANAEIDEAAKQMESLFMTLVVKELRKTIPGNGMFGSGPGSEIYEGFFDTALGEALSSGTGTGLRQSLAQNIEPHQVAPATSDHSEVSQKAAAESKPERTER